MQSASLRRRRTANTAELACGNDRAGWPAQRNLIELGMALKPDFIDSRDGNTLVQALGAVLGVSAGGGLGEAVEPPTARLGSEDA